MARRKGPTFGQTFAAARELGQKTFDFGGRTFTTKLRASAAPSTAPTAAPRGRLSVSATPVPRKKPSAPSTAPRASGSPRRVKMSKTTSGFSAPRPIVKGGRTSTPLASIESSFVRAKVAKKRKARISAGLRSIDFR